MNSLLAPAPLAFFATSPQPCPYLPDRFERRLVTDLSRRDAVAVHDALSQAGFRRSHTLAYAPICQGCQACVPVRVDAAGFAPGRALRRVLARNADILLTERPPVATKEQYRLFVEYQNHRHDQGEMAKMAFPDYQALIEQTPVRTAVLEGRFADGRLAAVAIFDSVSDGLSAVYSFFDTADPRRSLGSFLIVKLIEMTLAAGLSYLYLGFWIAETTKMAYKTRCRPLEAYAGAGWQRIELDGTAVPASLTEPAPAEASAGGAAPGEAPSRPAATGR
jgi:arginine-tRNA-protein transferase